ncbi:unnamed protein product [Litomosoides sigmodontis]|uniref:Uncharacterized protein n=1 Tax=Litomosoides sigmodontis TaxID=42156 RepID=A0A3P6UYU2_LITSI|nr:unnamed protein product [Litomosoides sigmodontis]
MKCEKVYNAHGQFQRSYIPARSPTTGNMWKFLMIILVAQFASGVVLRSGGARAQNPVFEIKFSPPVEWTYHKGAAHNEPSRQSNDIK